MNQSIKISVVLAVFFIGFVFAAELTLPAYITGISKDVISAWLSENPSLTIATEKDCNCEKELRQYRKGGGVWPEAPGYQPYFVVGDFNQDSIEDVAVVVKNGKDGQKRYLAIFNGPLKAGIRPVYFKSESGALFYGAPRPEPYYLIAGIFNSEGTIFEFNKNTYMVKEDSEY